MIGFLDGNADKRGLWIEEAQVLGGVEMLPGLTYDWIYIGTVFWKPVRQLLLDVGMPPEKLVVELPEDMASPVRTAWLEC